MNPEIISKQDAELVGTFAAKVIKDEFSKSYDFLQKKLASENNSECCSVRKIIGHPCHHILASRTLEGRNPHLSLEDIPLKWQHNKDIANQRRKATLCIKSLNKPNSQEWSYSNCIIKFEDAFISTNTIYTGSPYFFIKHIR